MEPILPGAQLNHVDAAGDRLAEVVPAVPVRGGASRAVFAARKPPEFQRPHEAAV